MFRQANFLFRRNEHSFYVRIAVPKRLREIFQLREIKRTLPTKNWQIARLQASYISSGILELFIKYEMFIQPDTSKGPNTVNITALNLASQQDLTALFHSLKFNAPQKEVLLSAVEDAFKEQVKVKKELTISQFFDELRDIQEKSGKWKYKVVNDYSPIIDLLIEIIGDKNLNNVDFNDAKRFFDTCRQLPRNRNRVLPFREMSIGEILQIKPEPMSVSNVNKYIDRVRTVFKHAEDQGLIERNPFSSRTLQMKDSTSKKDKRSAFSDEDLRKIFEGHIYNDPQPRTRPHYWAYLLFLYTGARTNEICQLGIDDIKQKDGIWFIDINDSTAESQDIALKSTKRETTNREVPIHKELIELGFLTFVDNIKARNEKDKHGLLRLFPEYTYTEQSNYGKKCSEYFNGKNGGDGYRHRVGVGTSKGKSKLVLYSFRHTLSTDLERAGVSEKIGFAITGHSTGNNSGNIYRKGPTLEQKKEAIEKVSYSV